MGNDATEGVRERTDMNDEATRRVSLWLWVCGRGGIRTHDGLAAIPVFETGRFNHSRTLPSMVDVLRDQYSENAFKIQFVSRPPTCLLPRTLAGVTPDGTFVRSPLLPMRWPSRPQFARSGAFSHTSLSKTLHGVTIDPGTPATSDSMVRPSLMSVERSFIHRGCMQGFLDIPSCI